MNLVPQYQIDSAISRWNKRQGERSRNLRLISEGRPLEADTPTRVQKFLARRGLTREGVSLASENLRAAGLAPSPDGILERVMGTNDLVGRAFLDRCLKAAGTVGRVWMGVTAGKPIGYGTGFLISPRLLMTNHHVLGDRAIAATSMVEMNYEIGIEGAFPTATFAIDVESFFAADKHLDYAVIALRSESPNGRRLAEFGWNQLVEEEGKAIVAQWVNIIQHPNGEPKQFGLRENQVIDIFPEFFHYKTDTAPGSSGSPVFNDLWEVVGLHHSGIWKKNAAGQVLARNGQPWRPEMGENEIDWIANEGIRISQILKHLRAQQLTPPQRALFDEIFQAPPESLRPAPPIPPQPLRPAPLPASISSGTSVNVRVESDGEIIVSVKTGTPPAVAASNLPSPAGAADGATIPTTPGLSTNRDEILAAARAEFAGRTDVLAVRWGYVFKSGWITKEPALVVTVRRKKPLAELREAAISPLPDHFGGYPIEVTGPTPEQLLASKGEFAATESFVSQGAISPEEITYTPPANASLAKVTETMRVIAHVSPDSGWTQLSSFLKKIDKKFVVAMFDFGAPHILAAVEKRCRRKAFRKFTLAIQPGESIGDGTKVNDLADAAVVDELSDQLKTKFESAWVKIGKVNGWVASSYHIKVAVRDSAVFWLSSGNWQSSNQPEADPLGEQPQKSSWLKDYNREWHAIVENPGLAKTYETFIQNDFAHNSANDPNEALAVPDLLLPDLVIPEAAERIQNFQYFEPFDKQRKFTVTPILSPDNYFDEVLALVRNAQEELLIQNQTFNAPGENHAALRKLMTVIRERQEAGIQVRIIFRDIVPAKVRENLEALQDFGFDMDRIRIQKNCHTKGIIVDQKRVLLGSQNLSNDGVSVNRDASLLFDDPELARYFAKIFEHDWNNLARHDIGHESAPVELALATGPTPQGMVRMSWKDYLETL